MMSEARPIGKRKKENCNEELPKLAKQSESAFSKEVPWVKEFYLR